MGLCVEGETQHVLTQNLSLIELLWAEGNQAVENAGNALYPLPKVRETPPLCSFYTHSFLQMWKSLSVSSFSLKVLQRGLQRDPYPDPSPLVMISWVLSLGELKPLSHLYHFSRKLLFFLKMLYELEVQTASSNYSLVGTPCVVGLIFLLTDFYSFSSHLSFVTVSDKISEWRGVSSSVGDWAFGG